jgi:hypothetical protein
VTVILAAGGRCGWDGRPPEVAGYHAAQDGDDVLTVLEVLV